MKRWTSSLLTASAVMAAASLVVVGAGAGIANAQTGHGASSKSSTSTPSKPLLVETTAGSVYGQTFDGVNEFRGIPYGSAGRFEMPEPIEPWTGAKSALAYGEVCPNGATTMNGYEWSSPSGSRQVENEDCQFVNVWSPSSSKSAKPVIVFLHGGGFTNGASNELAYYEGANMAKSHGVVFASLNGRLNSLGFTDLSAYGDEYKNSGNVGMADLVLGLQWVHDNIAQFGGDPSKVTIVGQSGGAGKVLTLMGMPAAQGLFQKAMAISGGVSGRDQAAAQAQTSALFAQLGIADGDVAALKAVPYPELNAAASAIRMSYGPVVDGEYYPEKTINDAGEFSALSKDVPLVMSSTFSEFNTPVIPFQTAEVDPTTTDSYQPNVDDARARELLTEKYGDSTEEIITEFKRAYPGHTLYDLLQLDDRVRETIIATATAKANQKGAPVFTSLFSYEFPAWGGIPAFHTGGDLPFLFDNVDTIDYFIGGDEKGAQKLATEASTALAAFASADKLSTKVLKWAAFTPEKKGTLVFDSKTTFRENFDTKLRDLIANATD